MANIKIYSQRYEIPFKITWVINSQEVEVEYTDKDRSKLICINKLLGLTLVMSSDANRVTSVAKSSLNSRSDAQKVKLVNTDMILCGLKLNLEEGKYTMIYKFTDNETYSVDHNLSGTRLLDKVTIDKDEESNRNNK